MEYFSLALALVFVLIIAYALYRFAKFFATDTANFAYRTEKDANGKEYEIVVDLNPNTKEKE